MVWLHHPALPSIIVERVGEERVDESDPEANGFEAAKIREGTCGEKLCCLSVWGKGEGGRGELG